MHSLISFGLFSQFSRKLYWLLLYSYCCLWHVTVILIIVTIFPECLFSFHFACQCPSLPFKYHLDKWRLNTWKFLFQIFKWYIYLDSDWFIHLIKSFKSNFFFGKVWSKPYQNWGLCGSVGIVVVGFHWGMPYFLKPECCLSLYD